MRIKYLLLIGAFCFSTVQFASAKSNNAVPKKSFTLPKGASASDYVSKTIVFKVNEQYRNSCTTTKILDADIQLQLNKLGTVQLKKLFPNSTVPEKKYNQQGQAYADLSLIYQLVYSNNFLIEEAINQLLLTNKLEYAEPKYINKMHLTVNDPSTNQQSFLTRINAYNGWNTSTGDTNVVIGIVDSGTDIDHPDLVGNLKRNYADPVNGIDDDGNGYIDDYRGWNAFDNDGDEVKGYCSPDEVAKFITIAASL
jgi:hypothetical protein